VNYKPRKQTQNRRTTEGVADKRTRTEQTASSKTVRRCATTPTLQCGNGAWETKRNTHGKRNASTTNHKPNGFSNRTRRR